MSYLINTNKPYPSVEKLLKEGGSYVELASADYLIPAVWFMFFNEADLIEVECEYTSSDGVGYAKVLMPSTTTGEALKNIQSSTPFLVSIFGNKEITEGYLKKTIEFFEQLDYEYLILDGFDFLIMNVDESEWYKLGKCFGRDHEAGRYIKDFCGHIDGVTPYPIDELYSISSLSDQDKINNSKALDPSFSNADSRLRFPAKPKTMEIEPQSKIKWWQIWKN